MNLTEISKAMSHALRHEPWLYEIELDDEGWTSVESLITSLRQDREEWQRLSIEDLERVIVAGTKRRFEIQAGRIRAFYGHSLPEKLIRLPAVPPRVLYHGTSPVVMEQIRINGLQPMLRQYVHCSADIATAEQVGRRKATHPVILKIRSGEAQNSGVVFYAGNQSVWLADNIPPQFIDFPR